MSDAKWGKHWYESPMQITRGGKTYYFIGRIDSFTKQQLKDMRLRARRKHISLRAIRNKDEEQELWVDSKKF